MNGDVTDEHMVETQALEVPTLATEKNRQDGARKFCGWSGGIRPLVVAAAVAAFAAGAWGQHFKVDPASSEVHFTLGSFDGPVNGTFKATAGEFTLDPASGSMTGTITVDATSGDSGNKKRDKKMESDQMKAQAYPTVTFSPTKFSGQVKESGDSAGQVDGNFTILGQGHPISVPMNVHVEGDRFTATGEFTVPFVSWGMKDPSFMMMKVEKQVKVQLKLAGSVSK